MTQIRRGDPMTSIDERCIRALKDVRGMSTNAQRIADRLAVQAKDKEPVITVRQRLALYAICWRFRRQIPMKLQVKVTLALAEAKAAAEEFRMNEPEPIRAFRSIDGGKAQAAINPLDDLFPDTVAPATA